MIRQAISPRLAIRIRLNMGLFTCNLWAGALTRNLARGGECNNSVVQQNQAEATVDMPESRLEGRSS
jgi:hypothetical protein